MPARVRICLTLFALMGVSAGAAAAQTPDSTTLHARPYPPSRTINLDVVVTGRSGAPVGGLTEKDFALLDDKTPQAITAFHAYSGKEEPVRVILLIDSVNTSFSIVSEERIQIEKFLRANGGMLAQPMALAVLTNKGVQIQQGVYTRDGNGLAKALDTYTIGLREIGRSGGFEGAAERFQDSIKAVQTLGAYTATQPGRKIILWVSPGWPLLSGPRVELSSGQEEGIFNQITSLSAQLRESQTTIYSVNPLGPNESVSNTFYYEQFLDGVKKPSQANIGNLALQVIATNTGGLVLNSNDISQLLEQCVENAGVYYRISFEPPAAEHRDVYHSLKVTVGQPGLTARTSTGYYAEP